MWGFFSIFKASDISVEGKIEIELEIQSGYLNYSVELSSNHVKYKL